LRHGVFQSRYETILSKTAKPKLTRSPAVARWADRTAYIWKPAFDFQSRKKRFPLVSIVLYTL